MKKDLKTPICNSEGQVFAPSHVDAYGFNFTLRLRSGLSRVNNFFLFFVFFWFKQSKQFSVEYPQCHDSRINSKEVWLHLLKLFFIFVVYILNGQKITWKIKFDL